MKKHTLALLPLALAGAFAHADDTAAESGELETVYVTAEKQLQQSLGVSRISAQDIDKRPAVNDISELVRTMPGVNLTGNTATGQRGNKRQIDLRGMGPENTLILIDGKPVTSRNSERISMRGERNTRGDSNWVPVEEIESITVLRGPAAARYGSGAMGGVVNIVTKKVTNQFKGQINLYANQPQDSKEGKTRRMGFNLSGPIVQDKLGFRVYGNLNKTDADAADINAGRGNDAAAGVEGVRNKDIAGRLQWKITPSQTLVLDSSYSRQGNIYNGDTQNSVLHPANAALVRELAANKAETARLYRSSYSLTHDGAWEWGDTKNIISYERTTNSHLPEALGGGPEGSYNGRNFVQSRLKNLRLSSEANIPFKWGVDNVLTIGAEFTDSKLDDPDSNKQGFTDQGRTDVFSGISANRGGKNSQRNWALYVEDNISLTGSTQLIPALRFDHNSHSGGNWSPGLNFSQKIGENWLIKGGIARAYKAPNLYQTSPDFILYTRGNGCPIYTLGRNFRCYYMGNANLKPETSINKEIGAEFLKNGWQASATYFHNAYRNKIVIGDTAIAVSNIGNWLLQWTNSPKATVSGFEGNLVIPLHDKLKWSNNFTYMQKSEDFQGNPLSMIPKHTINSTLAFTPNERFDANLTFTHYGRIKPRSVAINRTESSGLSQTEVGSYGLWGINAGYNWNKRIAVRGGISNLFDKKIYRTASGAQSFNEHGRAFYTSLKVSF
ncbi:MAG: FepA family TonB-dependent siderophore receptor [Neisseria sp.]|nr:FepA family TonB-dependent siderophore receptor [Neisseria sp.]